MNMKSATQSLLEKIEIDSKPFDPAKFGGREERSEMLARHVVWATIIDDNHSFLSLTAGQIATAINWASSILGEEGVRELDACPDGRDEGARFLDEAINRNKSRVGEGIVGAAEAWTAIRFAGRPARKVLSQVRHPDGPEAEAATIGATLAFLRSHAAGEPKFSEQTWFEIKDFARQKQGDAEWMQAARAGDWESVSPAQTGSFTDLQEGDEKEGVFPGAKSWSDYARRSDGLHKHHTARALMRETPFFSYANAVVTRMGRRNNAIEELAEYMPSFAPNCLKWSSVCGYPGIGRSTARRLAKSGAPRPESEQNKIEPLGFPRAYSNSLKPNLVEAGKMLHAVSLANPVGEVDKDVAATFDETPQQKFVSLDREVSDDDRRSGYDMLVADDWREEQEQLFGVKISEEESDPLESMPSRTHDESRGTSSKAYSSLEQSVVFARFSALLQSEITRFEVGVREENPAAHDALQELASGKKITKSKRQEIASAMEEFGVAQPVRVVVESLSQMKRGKVGGSSLAEKISNLAIDAARGLISDGPEKTNPRQIATLVKHESAVVRKDAARNRNATADALQIAIGDEERDVRLAAAGNPNATEEILQIAIGHEERDVRRAAASNQKATEGILQVAIADKDGDVRAAAADNPNATDGILQIAIADGERNVRRAAAENHNATEDILQVAIADADWNVRRAAAGNPNATEEVLRTAIGDLHPWIRAAAASNPNATEEILKTAIRDEEQDVRINAARHPAATEKILGKAIKTKDIHVRLAAAGNPAAAENILKTAIADEQAGVREAAAGNPNATAEILKIALGDTDWNVRWFAAGNPAATEDVLRTALGDTDLTVRKSAARHPNATEDLLQTAIADKQIDVRAAAADNPSATPEILKIAIADTDRNVRRRAAGNPNAPPEILKTAVGDTDRDVRLTASRHSSATPEILKIAIEDNSWRVRESAASHSSATEEVLQIAIEDNYENIRAAAARHPAATDGILKIAIADKDGDVRSAAAGNPAAPPGILKIAIKDTDDFVRRNAADNPSATPDILKIALADKNESVRFAATSNPAATETNPALQALRATEASFGQGRFSAGDVATPDDEPANSTAAER